MTTPENITLITTQVAVHDDNQLVLTPLLLKRLALAMQPETKLFVMEGPARSSKTALAIVLTYLRAYNSPNKFHAITGQTLGTIDTNLLDADVIGFMSTHPNVHRTGNRLFFKGADKKEKIIILAGYLDADQWKKVCGGSIATVLVDEANLADMNFIRELFARKLAIMNPLIIFTLNGDDPNHAIYQEFINKCKIVGDVPYSTRKLMETYQAKNGITRGYYYCHFKMSDNPFMQAHPEKLDEAMGIYPMGSYYYITKILGERGVPGDLIFQEYMTAQGNNLFVDITERLKDYQGNPTDLFANHVDHYTIGADIGATKAHNVFTLEGWNADNSLMTIIKSKSFKQCGYEEKRRLLCDFLDEILWRPGLTSDCAELRIRPSMIEGIFPDSAEQNFIFDLKPYILTKYGIPVSPSYKATIKERIDMFIVGFCTHRIRFHRNAKWSTMNVYNAYASAVWEKEHKNEVREDKNQEINDIMDSTEYGASRHMKALMTNGK